MDNQYSGILKFLYESRSRGRTGTRDLRPQASTGSDAPPFCISIRAIRVIRGQIFFPGMQLTCGKNANHLAHYERAYSLFVVKRVIAVLPPAFE